MHVLPLAHKLSQLLKRSGYVCFMSGSVHFYAPLECFDGPERVTAANLQVIHILRPPCAMRGRGMLDDDEVRISGGIVGIRSS